MSLTAARARELLDYNRETGALRWRIAPRRGISPGSVAGGRRGRYVTLQIDGKKYQAHRVAFLIVTGIWPADEIDHRDLSGLNNEWANLREASPTQNKGNTGVAVHNTSGVKGVSWDKARGRWVAMIKIAGKQRNLRRFDNLDAAAGAYLSAAKKHFGDDFARAA